jgi:hypothetical protein
LRITQVRSPKDAAWFVADQLAHGLIGWVPVALFARRWQDVAIAAAIILTIREGEQARETLEEWLEVRKDRGAYAEVRSTILCLLDDLHLPDRVTDVSLGTLAAVGWCWLWPSWLF